jgi:hypothetical protein
MIDNISNNYPTAQEEDSVSTEELFREIRADLLGGYTVWVVEDYKHK